MVMLNLINRIVVSLVLVILIVLLVAVAVTPDGVAGFLANLLLQVRVDTFSVTRLIVTAGSLVAALLLLTLLGQELRRPKRGGIILHGEDAREIGAQSVVQRIRSEVEGLPGVRGANVTLNGGGQVVSPFVEARVDPDVEIPTKAAEIDQVTQDTVSQLGLKLGKVRVKLNVVQNTKKSQPKPPPPSRPSTPTITGG